MTANYIDVDVHKVDKYGNSAVKPKRQGSTQTHRRPVPVNKIELLCTQLGGALDSKCNTGEGTREGSKRKCRQDSSSPHTPPLKIDKNVSSALPSAQVTGTCCTTWG